MRRLHAAAVAAVATVAALSLAPSLAWAQPAQEEVRRFDTEWGGGFITPDFFAGIVFDSLTRE